MKVLQTLGRHSGAQEGIFQYRRTAEGVEIDGSIGRAQLTPPRIGLTSEEWNSILTAIGNSKGKILPLTKGLYKLLGESVPRPVKSWTWNDSWKSYACAILEHEGSVDLYHGTLERGKSAAIYLKGDLGTSCEAPSEKKQ